MAGNSIRTLLVDDEPIARAVLREELEVAAPEIAIVGEAENGEQAIRQINNLHPDLVFLDLQMPGMNGLEVVRSLEGPNLPCVVIVTAYDQYAIRAFEAGAVDYLLKPVAEDRLQKAVERAKMLLHRPVDIANRVAAIASVSVGCSVAVSPSPVTTYFSAGSPRHGPSFATCRTIAPSRRTSVHTVGVT